MKKTILFVLITIFSFSKLYAQQMVYFISDEDNKPPKKNEVVVITRATLSPSPNMEFYSKYSGPGKIYPLINEKNIYKKPKIFLPTAPVYSYALGDEGVLNGIKMDIPKDRVIKLDYFRCFLVNDSYMTNHVSPTFVIPLPLYIEFTVPEGVNYIYIGSFTYNWTGFLFDIKNVKKADEYDDAVKFVAQKYGSSAKLERVPLREMQKEDKKKK